MQKRTVCLPGTILLAMATLLFSCKKSDSKIKGNGTEEYKTMLINPLTTTLFTKFPVSIQGQQQVEVRPMIEGYIESIHTDEGAVVKKGQLLFTIKAPQYEQEVITAQADINIAQENVNMALMDVKKIQPLVEDNIISAYELQTAQNNLNSRKATLLQARAKLANAKTNLSYTTVVSPIDGVIGLLPFKIGSLVGPTVTTPLTKIANTRKVHAYFSMNEKQILQLNKDSKPKRLQDHLAALPPVKLFLADGSEFSVDGTVEASGGLINYETGSINMRATFDNPNYIINSGSSGIIHIPVKIESAILIPQNATYEIQDKKFVYVADAEGVVRSAEIKVMVADQGDYYVVTEGLRHGEMIVLEGISSLKSGQKINVKKIDRPEFLNVNNG